ncbi:TonB-dependent receptor [Candidatus Poribacteria bacterium]|nr:TonB-dependent receptor [Candidatus Poribacteria bacterium]
MFRGIFLSILVLFVLFPEFGLAEEDQEKGEYITLEEILVTAKKLEKIQRDEVKVDESTTPVGANPVDILRNEAGIDVNRLSLYSPTSKMMKLRAFDTEKTLVTLDGRPLNGAGVRGGYQVDWGMIQLQDVEKIEVIKGATSAEYGNTLGGVINVVPRMLEEKLRLKLNSGAKSYNTYNVNAFASHKIGLFGFTLGAGYLDTDGFLRNSFTQRADFSPTLYIYLPDSGKLKFSLRYSNGEYGMPIANKADSPYYNSDYPESDGSRLVGPGFGMQKGKSEGDNSYVWKARYEADVAFDKSLMDVRIEARLYGNYEDRIDYFYAMDDPALLFLERRAPSDTSWGWSLKTGKEISQHAVKGGLEGNYMGYEGTEYLSYNMDYLTQEPQDSEDRRNISKVNSAFLQDSWAVLSNLDVYLGMRVDGYNASGGGDASGDVADTTFSPKLGIYFSPITYINTFATAARATKFPIIPKYYWYYNGYQPEKDGIDRKPLTYEDALQFEVGGSYRGIRDSEISLKGYYYDVKDYLRWIFGYKPSRVVYNLDYVRITGVEFEIGSMIYSGLFGFANYTWQRTEKAGDILDKSNISDQLGEIPANKINLGLEYRPGNGGFAKLTVKWVDERKVPINAANLEELGLMDSYTLLNGIIRYPILKNRFMIYAGCENILDTDYQESYGYPMPGRMFYGGLEMAY